MVRGFEVSENNGSPMSREAAKRTIENRLGGVGRGVFV